MVVRDNVTAGIDDEARTKCHDLLLRAGRGKWLLKKALQELIKGRAAGLRENAAIAGAAALILVGVLVPHRRLLVQLDRDVDGRRPRLWPQQAATPRSRRSPIGSGSCLLFISADLRKLEYKAGCDRGAPHPVGEIAVRWQKFRYAGQPAARRRQTGKSAFGEPMSAEGKAAFLRGGEE